MPQGILSRVAAGDAQAVDECLDQYGGLVWSVARRLSVDPADAEDAVQEVFIEVWRNAGRYDPAISSEATFIKMIARRRMIDRRRRHSRRIPTTAMAEEPAGADDNHQRQLELSEEAELAHRHMKQLRPEERRVLEMSIYQGMSHSEIAAATDLPLGTVKTHASAAKRSSELRRLYFGDRLLSGFANLSRDDRSAQLAQTLALSGSPRRFAHIDRTPESRPSTPSTGWPAYNNRTSSRHFRPEPVKSFPSWHSPATTTVR